MTLDDHDTDVSFDTLLAGKRAEADGGSHVPGTNFAARQSFTGTLTGRRMSQGDPPWQFLELGALTEKPEGFEPECVWCNEGDGYVDEG